MPNGAKESDDDDDDRPETVQISLTLKQETVEVLRDLYPHLLKTQHRLLAAISEVQEDRIKTRALLDHTTKIEESLTGIEDVDRRDDD
jgi:hypothetical protein